MTELGTRLYTNALESFTKKITTDKKATALAREAQTSTDYAIANEYAVRAGELMSEALNEATQGLAYMSYDVAQEVLTPNLTADYEAIAAITESIQANMNAASGVGLAPVVPSVDENRINGLASAIANCETMEDARQLLAEPVINYSQAIVDRSVRDNARANSKAGLKAYIVRKTGAPITKKYKLIVRRGNKVYTYMREKSLPCNWCVKLEGEYEYTNGGRGMNADIFRRHDACRCTLTYKQGTRRQNVWDHRQEWTEEDAQAQKKLTARELKRIEKEQQQERADKQTIKLHELGFEDVDEKITRLCDPKLMDANIQRLDELENRFNIFRRSQKPWIHYNPRIDAIAQTECYQGAYSWQGLVYSKDYKQLSTILAQQRRTSGNGWHMPCNMDSEYDLITYTTAHEYGHAMHNLFYQQALNSGYVGSRSDYVREMDLEVFLIAKDMATADPLFNPYDYMSRYGKKNAFESWAEMFANSQCGRPNILGDAMNVWLKQKGY